MIKDSKTFFLSLVILITPLLGLPLTFKFVLIIVVALILVMTSVDWEKMEMPHVSQARFSHPKAPELPATKVSQPMDPVSTSPEADTSSTLHHESTPALPVSDQLPKRRAPRRKKSSIDSIDF